MGKFKKMMNSSFLLERMDYVDVAKQLVKKYKFEVDDVEMIIIGTCNKHE